MYVSVCVCRGVYAGVCVCSSVCVGVCVCRGVCGGGVLAGVCVRGVCIGVGVGVGGLLASGSRGTARVIPRVTCAGGRGEEGRG